MKIAAVPFSCKYLKTCAKYIDGNAEFLVSHCFESVEIAGDITFGTINTKKLRLSTTRFEHMRSSAVSSLECFGICNSDPRINFPNLKTLVVATNYDGFYHKSKFTTVLNINDRFAVPRHVIGPYIKCIYI